ncbi:cytochrome c [Dehalococcoidia bacterium]|nr:cytochrome c [Dehalococcoidia bacterium]
MEKYRHVSGDNSVLTTFWSSKGILLLAALATTMLAGCSQGAYPIDFFPEMHYHQSYKIQEPPSLSAPAGSVPTTGTEIELMLTDTKLLENPVRKMVIEGTRQKTTTIETGQQLFKVNCAVCHGQTGLGDGPLKERLKTAGYRGTPADLTTTGPTNSKGDAEIFLVITKGFGGAYGLPQDQFVMPPFRKLLTEDERWTIAYFIKEFFQQ